MTSSWRMPSAAENDGLAYSISPWRVEHPDHVGRVVDDRADARGLARLGLGLGDLRVRADDRAVRQRHRARRDPDVAAVGVRHAELLVDAALRALHARGGQLLGRDRAAAGREQRRRVGRSADQHVDRHAEHARHRLVGVQDHAVRVPDEDSLFERRRQRERRRPDRRGRHRPAPIRYPTPRTVQTKSGERGSSASLRRRLEMWTSTRWSSPNQFSPQTRSSSCARENATRGCGGQRVEQVELDPGQLERDAVELDLAGGGVDGQRAEPAHARGRGAAVALPAVRRSTAFTRPTSSATQNGLVT